MNSRLVTGAVLIVWFALICTACKEQASAPTPAHDPLAIERTGQEAGKEDKEAEKAKVEKMLKSHTQDKGEILVGGCKESCEAPKNAFRNYVRALFNVEGEDAPKLERFVDTTMLVDNGEELGKRWADMWISGQLDKRGEEVSAWYEKYDTRCGKASGGKPAVEESLEIGLVFRRLSSKLVEFEYRPPVLEGAAVSDAWKVKMGMRGLEWLVQEIYDGN